MHDGIISLNEGETYRTSLTPPHFIEVPVLGQGWFMYICIRSLNFTSVTMIFRLDFGFEFMVFIASFNNISAIS